MRFIYCFSFHHFDSDKASFHHFDSDKALLHPLKCIESFINKKKRDGKCRKKGSPTAKSINVNFNRKKLSETFPPQTSAESMFSGLFMFDGALVFLSVRRYCQELCLKKPDLVLSR